MPGTGKRLLIVEDQELVAMTIASIVRRLNYDLVGSAATAERALELADEYMPDVVLMDLGLKGGRDGVETARAIKARIPVQIVFLTGAGDIDSVARMRSVQPSGIVLKPFRRTELTSKLAEAARSRVEAAP
jgi:DNA-binding NarL/FixJ family response regulator